MIFMDKCLSHFHILNSRLAQHSVLIDKNGGSGEKNAQVKILIKSFNGSQRRLKKTQIVDNPVVCLDSKYRKMLLLCCIVSMVLMIEFVDQTFAFPLLWLPAAVPTDHPISCQHTTSP